MPRLKDTSKIKKITLPSSAPDDPAVITIDTNLTAGQSIMLASSADRGEAMFDLVASSIKSWNFTGDDNEVVPITADAVRHMSVVDFTEIVTVFEGIADEIAAGQVSTAEKKD